MNNLKHIATKASTFASTFYFFSTQEANTRKNKKSLQAYTRGNSKLETLNLKW